MQVAGAIAANSLLPSFIDILEKLDSGLQIIDSFPSGFFAGLIKPQSGNVVLDFPDGGFIGNSCGLVFDQGPSVVGISPLGTLGPIIEAD